MTKKQYDVQDIINAGYTLKPLVCRFCKSTEVDFHQYIGDAFCSMCGKWQLEKARKTSALARLVQYLEKTK